MGELFRRTLPTNPLNWTGERLVTEIGGPIESEHLHRYFVARELCRGKTVLDVASGEGYGTALLAQTAQSAVGIEIDSESVKYASDNYKASNLYYLTSNAICLPLTTNSVDVVVSFETLEHFFDQDHFLAEIVRVLRPEGLLIISTPDADVYSGPGSAPNPYHVRELTAGEFRELLSRSFASVSLLHQRALAGSTIWPESFGCKRATWIYDQRSPSTFEIHQTLPRAPYLFALASNGSLPSLSTSIFINTDHALDPVLEAELSRLRQVEAYVPQLEAEIGRLSEVRDAYIKQDPIIKEKLAAAAKSEQEAAHLRVENSRLLEAEAESRRQILALESSCGSLNEETARLRTENFRLVELEAESQRRDHLALESLSDRLDKATEEVQLLHQQLHSANIINRQQALTSQRSQHELTSQLTRNQVLQQELEIVEQRYQTASLSLAQCKHVCDELAGLVIPVWIRKLFPAKFRSRVRGLRLALRSRHSS